ncbi:TIGR01841 family phasin [Caballeronia insecticola]|uniref:Phasin n=2 Tax=Burkholderiaceae TaxID=119060 RepID=R4X3M5_9BURK|nr:TIGR01841 family phasin [Caballeronia insecticola]BAN26512.1 phasin [Caballeronia insecticola]BAW99834.1 PHA-associated protein [Burkholderia sp. RPE75]
MFFFPQQQIASFQKASFQALMSLTNKYMDGFQKLTELNVQTIRTLVSENEGVSNPTPENASDPGAWQSKFLTQVPEKAASYRRHFFAIVSGTGEEVAREAQSQFASYGGHMNEIFKTAADSASEVQEKAAVSLETNFKQATEASVEATAGAADAVAKNTQAIVSATTDAINTGADSATKSADKANQKR